MALANYATVNDVGVYLPSVTTSEVSTLWTSYLATASRMIDDYCDRYFYADGTATKYFDGDGTNTLILPRHDFYALTALAVATGENLALGSPNWVTFDGDGITPPSQFFCEPANQVYVGSAGAGNRPFYRIEIPDSPMATYNFLSAFTKGKRTVSITANWGWPQVPDAIKDVCIKVVIRMWKAGESGWTGMVGSPETGGPVGIMRWTDINDRTALDAFRRWAA